MQRMWVRSLAWEDPLEEEMATHSSILAWRIPWTEEPGGLQSMGSQRMRQDGACRHAHIPVIPPVLKQGCWVCMCWGITLPSHGSVLWVLALYGWLSVASLLWRHKSVSLEQDEHVRPLSSQVRTYTQEKEMATHSSTVACKIPWTEDPGRLQSMGSERVRHDWATSLSLSFWRPLPSKGGWWRRPEMNENHLLAHISHFAGTHRKSVNLHWARSPGSHFLIPTLISRSN